MTQSDFGTIDPNTKNGTELATDLNTFRDAQNTLHRGSSVPGYAQGGTLWIDDSGAPTWIIKLNDGTDDLTLFTLDITANTVALAFDTIALTDAGTLASLSVIRSGTPPTANMVFFEDTDAANNFSNVEIKAHRPGLIFRDATATTDDFRLGADGNLFKISIDGDQDDTRDASGHFDDFPNAFVLDGATGFVGLTRAPTVALDLGGTVSGGDVRSLVENTSNTASATASFELKVGGTTAADPQLFFTIPSGSSWVMGADNSETDKFTLSLGATLGTGNAFTFDASLDAVFAGNLAVAGGGISSGVDDTTQGVLEAFGNAASGGGILRVHNAANEDTTYEFFQFEANGLTMRLGTSGVPNAFLFDGAGAFTTAGLATLASASVTANLDAASIGTGTPGTGAFTTLDASGDVTLSAGDLEITAGSLGIGIAPLTPLHVIAVANPAIRIEEGVGGSASHLQIIHNSPGQGSIQALTATGGATLRLHAIPSDGTSSAIIDLHRSVNTTGAVLLKAFEGDGAGTVAWQISSNAISDTIFNEQGLDINHRIEGVGQNDALFVQGSNGYVGVLTGAPASPLHVDQNSATGAVPVLTLDQGDVDQEMMEFITTIGVGNAIEAKGAKTLTHTHFVKVTIPGGLTVYFPVGTIA